MWTPPADELIEAPHTQAAPSGAWTPPQEELVGETPAMPEDPGLLKSAAAGLMSGVPLAESAVAGIEALSPDKTYEQAHQELEGLRDRAWDAHPVAYGAGKTAGMVGTGLVAPAGIPGALAVGAASGLDAANTVQDMPKAIAEGAAMGGILGTVGEKVISPLISKVMPATAKTMLGALGPGKEAVEARLANRGAIDSALTNPEASAKLAEGMNMLTGKADDLSETARGLLKSDVAPITVADGAEPGVSTPMGALQRLYRAEPKDLGDKGAWLQKHVTPDQWKTFESEKGRLFTNDLDQVKNYGYGEPTHNSFYVDLPQEAADAAKRIHPEGWTEYLLSPEQVAAKKLAGEGGVLPTAPTTALDTLKPIFDQVRQRFTQSNIANTPANESAVNALDSQYNRLVQIAKANGGKLSETDLKQQIVALQSMLKKNVFDNPDVSATKEALKELSGALNGALIGSNPAYGEAMKPVADLRGQITDLKDTFKPDYGEAGQFTGSDTMNSRLGGILKENKSNAQEMLQKLSDLTGFDFLGNAKNLEHKQAFENSGHGGAFSPLNLLLGTLGFGAGKATGIPMGGAAGAAVGHFAGRAMDGGQIAKNLIDMYLDAGKSLTDSGAKAALQKYGPMLVQAAKAGGTQLAATHFVLSTSHPEYQQLTQHMQDNQPQ